MLRAYGLTDKGRERPTNEDCFAIDEVHRLCVVADGMGGHNAGEVAARLAVDTIVDAVSGGIDGAPFGVDPSLSAAGNQLRTAIYLAHARILETAIVEHAYAGMGTTVVAVLIADGRVAIGHAGDSRVYLFSNGRLRRLTDDDSWLASMLADCPAVDPVALRHHPMRNVLTNVVGLRSHAQVHIVEEALTGGELLLLTTDGIHGVLDDRRIEQMLRNSSDLEETAGTFLSAALARGSRDNCTAVVARYVAD